MKVEVTVPAEFEQNATGSILKRKGDIYDTDNIGEIATLLASVPLNDMFGYATELRSLTEVRSSYRLCTLQVY